MNMKNWNGVWINTGKTMLTPSPEVGRAPYLRKTFSCSSNPRKATVSLCGLGWHELYVNGKRPTTGFLRRPSHSMTSAFPISTMM